jgi:hypothetical protein
MRIVVEKQVAQSFAETFSISLRPIRETSWCRQTVPAIPSTIGCTLRAHYHRQIRLSEHPVVRYVPSSAVGSVAIRHGEVQVVDRSPASVGWVCGAGRRGRRCCLAQPGARRRGLRIHAGSETWAAVAGRSKSQMGARCDDALTERSLGPCPGRAAAGRCVPAGRIRPAGVTFPLRSTVDGSRPGSDHDPDQAGRKSNGQHAAARTVPKQPSTRRAPRSQIMGNRAHLWDTKKAVSHVSPGHGLDLLRARRDSNPQPSDP